MCNAVQRTVAITQSKILVYTCTFNCKRFNCDCGIPGLFEEQLGCIMLASVRFKYCLLTVIQPLPDISLKCTTRLRKSVCYSIIKLYTVIV
jgi:hypothetical protein